MKRQRRERREEGQDLSPGRGLGQDPPPKRRARRAGMEYQNSLVSSVTDQATRSKLIDYKLISSGLVDSPSCSYSIIIYLLSFSSLSIFHLGFMLALSQDLFHFTLFAGFIYIYIVFRYFQL